MSEPDDIVDPTWDDASAAYDQDSTSAGAPTASGSHEATFHRIGEAIREPIAPPVGLLTAQVSRALDALDESDEADDVREAPSLRSDHTRRNGGARQPKPFLVAAASIVVVGVAMLAVFRPDLGSGDEAELSEATSAPATESSPKTTSAALDSVASMDAGADGTTGTGSAEAGAASPPMPSFGATTDLGTFTDDQQLLAVLNSVDESARASNVLPPTASSEISAEESPLAPSCPTQPGDVQLGSANLGGAPVLVLRTPNGITVLDPYECGRRVVTP